MKIFEIKGQKAQKKNKIRNKGQKLYKNVY